MLPRLTAETSILERERIAVGTGALEADAQQRILSAWRHQADPDGEVMRRTPKNVATPDALPGLGLGYEVVSRG